MKTTKRPSRKPEPSENRSLDRIRRGVNRTFQRLEAWTCLKAADLRDFRSYHGLMNEALDRIEEKVLAGTLHPLDLTGFPQVTAFPRYHVRAGLFIGSFDPFQMTHLTMALQFLAAPNAEADVVFVVPEGAPAAWKADRSDYTFRFDVLRAQVAEVFRPLVVPLDIGRDADTIEIVRRFIALFPGATMTLSHLMGTDSLSFVDEFGNQDREAWTAQAQVQNVRFGYRIFALPRGPDRTWKPLAAALQARGVPLTIGPTVLSTPSSTDLRHRAVFTILFPAPALLRRVEVLFRYSMNTSWSDPPRH